MHHEEAIIAAFVSRSKRARYREMLAHGRHRRKFIDKLAHFVDFDPKYRVSIPSNKLRVENIAHELRKRHSPEVVYAMSEDPALDQKELPLTDALSRTVGRGMGCVISCIPGILAFVETEDERFILERRDPLDKPEFIRFVIGRKDEDSHVEQGVFQAAFIAMERGVVTGSDAEQLYESLEWFAGKLERPLSFGRNKLRFGICWFKPTATQHISRVYRMVEILERNGVYVRKVRTSKPGYVVYEDEWQLVAEPFRKGTLGRK